MALSAERKTLPSTSFDRTIRLWDAATHLRLGVPLEGYTGGVWSVEFCPDSQMLTLGSDNRTIRLWMPRLSLG